MSSGVWLWQSEISERTAELCLMSSVRLPSSVQWRPNPPAGRIWLPFGSLLIYIHKCTMHTDTFSDIWPSKHRSVNTHGKHRTVFFFKENMTFKCIYSIAFSPNNRDKKRLIYLSVYNIVEPLRDSKFK